MTVESTSLSYLGLTPDVRHQCIVKPTKYHKGLAVQVPAGIVRKMGINEENIEYLLTVKEDGSLLYTPRPRSHKWVLSEEAI